MAASKTVIYKSLKRIERARGGGITVAELGEYLGENPRDIVAELYTNRYISATSNPIRSTTRLTIKDEGLKALLAHGLEMPKSESQSTSTSSIQSARARKKKQDALLRTLLIVVVCVACFILGALVENGTSFMQMFTIK